MKIYTEIQQNTPEWLQLRLGKFTCSDAQAISNNGRGLETLAFTKAAEILTKKIPEGYTNEIMERGKELEELARSAYELESQSLVKQVGFIELSEYVGGSPDGLIGEEGLVEIKCPTDRVFVEYLYYKKIDPAYLWQMQAQMYITDRKWVDFVTFNPNFERQIVITKVNRDEDMIAKLKNGLDAGQVLLKKILEKV